MFVSIFTCIVDDLILFPTAIKLKTFITAVVSHVEISKKRGG